MNQQQTVNSMLKIVEQTIDARTSRFSNSSEKPKGPLFTFLIGAGFSVTAGVSSVQHLVLSLEKFKQDRSKNWFDIFDETKNESIKNVDLQYDQITEHYFALIEEVLPLPQSRHDFITAAIQWASSRRVQINIESILLATLLIAGTGGDYPQKPGGEKKDWLARAFSKHVFTTNFDEVMPTTFYLGNSPVEIVDRDTSINLIAEYPTLVYLHGRHLHFRMRNTKHELKRELEENERDLFQQFRDVLRNTGLIVIGYAGAKDKVSQVIKDAIEDPESLPYGLWWSSYQEEEKSIHPDLLRSIHDNDRSFILEKGKDAEHLMRLLTRNVGIDDAGAISIWKDRLTLMNQEVNRFIDRAAFDFGAFNMTVAQALLFLDDHSLNNALNKWNDLDEFLMEHEDIALVIDILGKVTKLLLATNQTADFEKVISKGIEFSRMNGDELHEAYFLLDKGGYQLEKGYYEDAQVSVRQALEILKYRGNKVGIAKAYTLLTKCAVKSEKLDDAEKVLIELEEGIKGSDNLLAVADYYQVLGELCLAQGNVERAREAFTSACDKHELAGDQRDLINDKIGLLNCARKSNNNEEVNSLLTELKAKAELLDNTKYKNKIKTLNTDN